MRGVAIGDRGRQLGLLLVVVSVAWALTAAAAPREWVVATVAPEGSPTAAVVEEGIRLLERYAGATIRFRRRYGGVLGDEGDMLQSCRQGKIHLWAGSLGALVTAVPELRFLEVPYLFRDVQAFQRVMAHYRRGRDPALQSLFARQGLVVFGMTAISWRNFSSVRRPIRTLSDLRGMTVRAQPGGLHPVYLSALGARPKAVSLNEINTALDVDLIDAFDIPATFIYAGSLDSRIKHYTVTQHILQIGVMVIHRQAWDSLPATLRAAVEQAIEGIALRGELAHMAFDSEMIALLPQRGVNVIQPTPEALADFRAAARKVEEHVRRTGSKEEIGLLDRVKKIVAEDGVNAR